MDEVKNPLAFEMKSNEEKKRDFQMHTNIKWTNLSSKKREGNENAVPSKMVRIKRREGMTKVDFETKTKTSNSKVKRKRNKMLKTNRSNQRLRSYLLLFFWTETIPFRLCFRSFFSVFLFHFFFRSGNWLC